MIFKGKGENTFFMCNIDPKTSVKSQIRKEYFRIKFSIF